jgi:prefoldin beta subunit
MNGQKIQELQFLQQNIQNLIYQKQAFQAELSETQSAMKEIENSGDETFKLIGQIMVKTEKSKIQEELANKEKLLQVRIKTLESQETSLKKKLENSMQETDDSNKK